jgi:hypothetical protein
VFRECCGLPGRQSDVRHRIHKQRAREAAEQHCKTTLSWHQVLLAQRLGCLWQPAPYDALQDRLIAACGEVPEVTLRGHIGVVTPGRDLWRG